MARDVAARQWKIAAADVPTGVLFFGGVKLLDLEFTQYLTASDTVRVKDRTGRVIWETRGNGDLSSERTGRVGWVNGFQVDQMTSGELLVHIE